MIKYKRNLLSEKEIDYVSNEFYTKTATEMADVLNTNVRRIYTIREYVRHEVLKIGSPYSKAGDNVTYRKIPSLLFLYEITNDGLLRNVKSKRILKGTEDESGYYTITFQNKSIIKYYGTHFKKRIHQLVMEVWGPAKPNSNAIIDHIDRNKKNNFIGNLRWTDKLGNRRNSSLWLNSSKRYKAVKVNGEVFNSLAEVAKFISSQEHITQTQKNIANRLCQRRKHILGYDIEYII